MKKDFRQQLRYYRDLEPWKVWTRSVCYQSVYEDLESKKPLNMTDLRLQMDLELQEKDYVAQGYVGITRQMVVDEISKFEEYLPAIQQHISLGWPKRKAPSYDPAWMDLYPQEKRDAIITRLVTEEVTFENHLQVLHRTYPEVPNFEKYSQVYYRWYGNNYLRNSIAKAEEEKNGWKHVVKAMAKIDMVDTWRLREMLPVELKNV